MCSHWSGQSSKGRALRALLDVGGPWSYHRYYCAGQGGCFRVFGPLGMFASPAWAVSRQTGMDTSHLNSRTHAEAAERQSIHEEDPGHPEMLLQGLHCIAGIGVSG